jgi:Flp pilus assembly protein TadD
MILALALLLALADPASATPARADAAAPAISLAEAGRAIAAGRLDQAKAMLGTAVAAGAKGEPVDRLLADLALARGEYEPALGLYRALLATHPQDPLLLERGGIAALRFGRTTEATALLDRATRAPGAGWRSWNARGAAADLQGRWEEADAAYGRAMELQPDRAEIANNLGWSMMLRGRWADALASFERAASIDPKLPRLANNLELARAAVAADLPPRMPGEGDEAYASRLNDAGVVAAAGGQRERAEAAFAQAIELKSRWYARAADNLAALGGAK